MKRLFCFIGRPGCGKSTLLRNLGVTHYDVLKHIRKYFVENGKLPDESFALKAYQDLFAELKTVDDKEIYLELGVNHAEFVMSNLKDFNTTVVFCLLESHKCLERHNARGRKIATDQLMRRMTNPFPDLHLQHSSGINCIKLDMNNSIDHNLTVIKNLI